MYYTALLHSVLLFLFLILTPPTTLPLFPYTTLFRSLARRFRWTDGQPASHGSRSELACRGRRAWTLWFRVRARNMLVDRKSTRLNSSHRCISYAVFCLKKKITRYRGGQGFTSRRSRD